MNVLPPKHLKTHPDYSIDCEEALDLPLQDLIHVAVQAGWDTRTVIVALQSVAWNRAVAALLVLEKRAKPRPGEL
jgi:hypothetical protein